MQQTERAISAKNMAGLVKIQEEDREVAFNDLWMTRQWSLGETDEALDEFESVSFGILV